MYWFMLEYLNFLYILSHQMITLLRHYAQSKCEAIKGVSAMVISISRTGEIQIKLLFDIWMNKIILAVQHKLLWRFCLSLFEENCRITLIEIL